MGKAEHQRKKDADSCLGLCGESETTATAVFLPFPRPSVLGDIFGVSVYGNLAMPEFSSTLLGLMGISSGTYIGFEFPEQK